MAFDLSPSAERALDRAIELAGRGAALDVVYFLHIAMSPGWDAAMPDWSGLEASIAADLQTQGEALIAARRRPDGPSLRFLVRHVAAIPGVVHALEQEPYDLVALGTHGSRHPARRAGKRGRGGRAAGALLGADRATVNVSAA